MAFPGTDEMLETPSQAASDNRAASRRIIRGTATFAISAVLLRAGTLLLLPFFTRILSAEEYGQIGVITTLAAALSAVASLGLETAVFRGYVQAVRDPVAVRSFVNTVGGFAVLGSTALAIGVAALTAPLFSSVFSVPADAIRLAMVGAGINAAATAVPMALLRAQERHTAYLQLTAIQLIVSLALTILFVAVLGWGISGWMLAYSLSGALLLGRGLVILGHRWTLRFESSQLRVALAFGLPLIPHALSHWGLAVSDRAILGAFVSASQVGAYYVAFQFALPISLVAISISQATQPLYAEAISSAGRRAEIATISTIQVLAIVLAAATVVVLGPPAVLLLLPTSYAQAAGLVPLLAVGAGLFGLYLLPMNAVAMMAGRTRNVWLITVAAAGANIVLNLVLVPTFGPAAAAWNTVIGYGILLGGVYLYMRLVIDPPLRYEVPRIMIGMALIAAPCGLVATVSPANTILAMGIRAAVLMLVAVVLVILWRLDGPARQALHVIRQVREGDAP